MTHRLDIFFKSIFVYTLFECPIPVKVTKLLESVQFPEPEIVVGHVMRILKIRFRSVFFNAIRGRQDAITCEGSEKDFVTFVVPFCLELCKKASYPSFLLMCAFFKEVIFQALMFQYCYRVIYLSYKCLAYIYRRRFRKLLPPERGLDELTSLCSSIIENKEIMDDILPFQSTVELLENCKARENRLVLNEDDIKAVFGEIWWKVENSSDDELKGAVGPVVVPDCTTYSLPTVCGSQNVYTQKAAAAREVIHCVSKRRLGIPDSVARNVEISMKSGDSGRQNSPGRNECIVEDRPNLPGPSRTPDQNYQKYSKSHRICGFCDTDCFAFLNVVDQFKNCA